MWSFMIFFKRRERKRSMHFGVQLKPGTQSSIITGSFGVFFHQAEFYSPSLSKYEPPPSRFCSGSRSCANGAVCESSEFFQCSYHHIVNNSLRICTQPENSTAKSKIYLEHMLPSCGLYWYCHLFRDNPQT